MESGGRRREQATRRSNQIINHLGDKQNRDGRYVDFLISSFLL